MIALHRVWESHRDTHVLSLGVIVHLDTVTETITSGSAL